MKKIKKYAITFTATALSLGIFSSVVHAQSVVNEQQNQNQQIIVASTETVVTKTTLIKKLKELFPKKFDFLSSRDFYMNNAHYYPGDETIRYELSFSKTVKGKDVYGSITFVGDTLEIESFYYLPANQSEALFPAKTSKEDAKDIALNFVKKLPNGKDYNLENDSINFHSFYSNQILTEPIRYTFSFVKTENKIGISDQRIEVTVLGNGEVINVYHSYVDNKKFTFDNAKQIIDQKEILEKIKENISINLQYQINQDFQTGKNNVQLVYNPSIQLRGVNALTGEWQTVNGFSTNLPVDKKIEKIVENPLPPRKNAITIEEAKEIANQLLKIDSGNLKLIISSIEEMKNYNGQEVINIQYQYSSEGSGFGANLEIDKLTGEIIHYYNIKNDVLREISGKQNIENTLTNEQALAKAIEYLKEWAPSQLNNYSKPIEEPYIEKERGIVNFSFPRVVNGIGVLGDEIHVSISPDGSLNSLNVNSPKIEDWPSKEEIISENEAKNRFVEALSVKLQYVRINDTENHYSLVYFPLYNKGLNTNLDAITGKWNSEFGENEKPTVSHPKAEQELNYLIQNNIIEIKDVKNFDPDVAVTKGEALNIIVKSLTYFYNDFYPLKENVNQSFDNIDPDHPLYLIVERAVDMGILDTTQSFNPNSKLTKEQLAVWYIRALGLERAAKYSEIYKLDISDAKKVNNNYIGHVTLAKSLGLLKTEKNLFNPKKEITFADLAVSTIELAHEVYNSGLYLNKY